MSLVVQSFIWFLKYFTLGKFDEIITAYRLLCPFFLSSVCTGARKSFHNFFFLSNLCNLIVLKSNQLLAVNWELNVIQILVI